MKGRVYIETFGCQMNVADSERAAFILCEEGFSMSPSIGEADVIIINTCSVRAKAEHKFFSKIGYIAHINNGRNVLVGVMGCVAQLEGKSIFENAPTVQLVVGTHSVHRLPVLIERVRNGEQRVIDLDDKLSPTEASVPKTYRGSKVSAFVPIIEGCNKFCTYCIVPFSRGREKSRPANEIIDEVCWLMSEGFVEIHLIGQNVNSYRPKYNVGLEKFEGATPFSRLLRAIAATRIPRIKFTTSFPRDFHPDIVEAIDQNDNLCNWVHLPVQSGSDSILRAMRRGYKLDDFLKCVEVVKTAKRNIAMTSDIIVGFPGERDEDFNDTVKMIDQCRFDGLYIFKYSRRSGTPAAKLSNEVPSVLKTSRFLELERRQQIIQAQIYQTYLGSSLDVLVEGISSRSETDLTGHTTCHKVVNFPGNESAIGKVVKVRITKANNNSLYGEMNMIS